MNLKGIADNTRPKTLATRSRQRRFRFFKSLVDSLPKPLRILDVGGTRHFWETMGFCGSADVQIILLNTEKAQTLQPNLSSVAGDARDMVTFRSGEFDVVFSSSVIEHVGTFKDQRLMADEVRRVGKRYFVQTPNRYFPIEPHFLFPLYQFLPLGVQIWLLTHYELGWLGRIDDPEKAAAAIRSIRLLTRRELKQLFPGCEIYGEKFLGITKSFVAYAGWRRGRALSA